MANNDQNNGSAKALIETGKGGKKRQGSRYQYRDKILKSIAENPYFTANEIAFESNGWTLESYKNCAKRAHDLVLLGYVEQLKNRKCRVSGKGCHTFKITDKGLGYLRKESMLPVPKEHILKPPLARVDIKSRLSGLKSVLN